MKIFRKYIQIIFILKMMNCVAQTPKLIVFQEHVGYKSYFYQNDSMIETKIVPGEKWQCVHPTYGKFEVQSETLTWDTSMSFSRFSDSSNTPFFAFQGFNPYNYGEAADVSFPIWKFEKERYYVINKNDSSTKKITADFIQEIYLDDDTIIIFKSIKNADVKGPQLLVMWAGDLNKDDQPDMVLRRGYDGHSDFIKYDLILSSVTNKKVSWKKWAGIWEWR